MLTVYVTAIALVASRTRFRTSTNTLKVAATAGLPGRSSPRLHSQSQEKFAFANARARQSSLSTDDASEDWRRGELNPCPRRYPRKHLHVYPAINSEEPSRAPAHYRLPSVHEIDSQTGAVAPPICQPAVHVFAASRRYCENVTVN